MNRNFSFQFWWSIIILKMSGESVKSTDGIIYLYYGKVNCESVAYVDKWTLFLLFYEKMWHVKCLRIQFDILLILRKNVSDSPASAFLFRLHFLLEDKKSLTCWILHSISSRVTVDVEGSPNLVWIHLWTSGAAGLMWLQVIVGSSVDRWMMQSKIVRSSVFFIAKRFPNSARGLRSVASSLVRKLEHPLFTSQRWWSMLFVSLAMLLSRRTTSGKNSSLNLSSFLSSSLRDFFRVQYISRNPNRIMLMELGGRVPLQTCNFKFTQTCSHLSM